MQLPTYPGAQQYHISPDGLQELISRPKDPQYPGRHILWTDDITVELPIRIGTTGVTSHVPTTLIDEFKLAVTKYGHRSALSSKVNGVWVPMHSYSSPTTTNSTTKNVLLSVRPYWPINNHNTQLSISSGSTHQNGSSPSSAPSWPAVSRSVSTPPTTYPPVSSSHSIHSAK